MQAHIACPGCDGQIDINVAQDEFPGKCPYCNVALQFNVDGEQAKPPLENCVYCGKNNFYKCTQINPTFGIGMVFSAFVLFLLFVYFIPGLKGFLLGMSVLLAAAVLDRLLRMVLPEIVICYDCKTIYSQVPNLDQFNDYDHEQAAEVEYG